MYSIPGVWRILVLPFKLLLAVVLYQPSVLALPQGGVVTQGAATIQQESPTKLNIHQSSDRAVINWHSFSIGAPEWVNFQQPSSTSATLNRVTGNTPSSIAGKLTANGQIFLINPNGIAFLPTAQVDVAGLVASTLNIKDSDFMQGILRFEQMPGKPPASVVNQGLITVKEAGFAALVAPAVQNSGVISARLGKVVLASGTTVSLDFYGDGLLSVTVDPQLAGQITDIYGNKLSSLIDNQGTITAPGGIVTLSAQAAGQIVDRVINTGGIIEAKYAENRNGVIVLSGGSKGTVAVNGVLDVSGEKGGKVQITGENVGLFGSAKVDASGDKSGGLVFIGGDYLGGRADKQRVDSSLNAQNTYVSSGSVINADAKVTGNGGEVIVWGDNFTRFDGTITARGDNGGFVETSGKNILEVGGTAQVDTTGRIGKTGTWLLDPLDLTISGTGTNTNVTGASPFTPTGAGSILRDTTINTALATNNVVVTTVGTPTAGNGDITFTSDAKVNWSTDKTFTVQAHRRIVMEPGSKITSTNTGSFDAVIFEANKGNVTGNFSGIKIEGKITTNGGNVKLWGQGGTTNNNNYGVQLTGNQAVIETTSGKIEITGLGGTSTGINNYGVYLSRGARLESTSGNIILDGTAQSLSGPNADGVYITTTPRLDDDPGTLPASSLQTQILNQDGNIKITGLAQGSGGTSDGIAHWNALVQTTGTGNIIYYGVSGTGIGGGNLDGLELQRNGQDGFSSQISTTGSGSIVLTGVLRGGAATDRAIKFGEPTPTGGFNVITNTGDICLTGEDTGTATSSTASWYSIKTDGAAGNVNIKSTGGGNIILTGDRIDLAVNPNLDSTGVLVIQPFTPSRDIDLLGTAPDTTHLAINSTEFGFISNNFSHIIFGRDNGTGILKVQSAINRNQNLTLRTKDIELNAPVTLGATKVLSLIASTPGGNITQTAPFTANGLILGGLGTFVLNNANNDVNIIATAGSTGGISYTDKNALTVGSLSVPTVTILSFPDCCSSTTLNASGITTNNADVIIRTNNLLTLDKATNVGTGNLTLNSNGGVTQNVTGVITANGLGLQGTGTFDLNNANNDVDTLAAQVNGGVSFKDVDTLTIGGPVISTVGTDTATTTAGLNTNNKDAIIETGNTLSLNAATNVGTGNLTLNSGNGVDQTGAGVITASGLGLQGTGTFDLNNANNDVDTLAAQVNGGVSFKDVDTLTIGGPVTSTVGTDTATTTAGLNTNNKDAIIQTGNTLSLNAATNVGTGNLTLISGNGVNQTGAGVITASGLGLQGTGTFDLNNANNDVDTLAAQVNGGVSFKDVDTLTIGGPVTSTVGTDTATTTAGLNTNNKDAIIQTGNTLSLNAATNVGTGNLTLISGNGVTQSATGVITASGLGLQGTGTFDLNNANNDVDTLAAQVNGGVSFKDVDTLTIGGPVTSTVGTDIATTIAGLNTNNKDAIIQTGNTLSLNAATNVGTGNLTLISGNGVNQTGAGVITASGLGLQGTGTFDLNNANNDVDTLAAQVNGGVSFKDVDTLTLGEVTSTVGSTTKTTSGLTTNNNDAIIETSGLLTLDKATNLGTGNLTLVSNGGVTQNAGGDIQAKGLGLQGAGTFSLENANNDVDTFAAQVNGGVSFKDVDTLTLGEVTSTVGSTTKTTSGLTTNNNDAIIETSGLLTLDKATNLGTGNLTLVSNGGVTQNAGGDIQAKGLGLQGAGTFSLENANNDVDTFAAQVNGGVSFKDVDTLTLGEVTSTVGSTTKTTSGLTTNNNDAIIETSGLLTLDKATNLGTGNLTLVSNGGVTQNAGGDIQAKGLGLQGAGTFSLENANNDVDTFAAQVNGGVSFKDVDTLTLGEVTSTVGSTTKTTSGLTTNNDDAIIETSGLLTLDKATNLGTGNLTLVSNGGVTQNAGGDIQAKGLGLQGAGTFSLENANNDVDTFAAQVNGGVSFKDVDTLTLGEVTSTVGSTTKTTSGLTTNNNDAIIETSGLLTLDKATNLGTGNLTLVSNGGVTQNAGGDIQAKGLGLQGAGTFSLENANNDVDTFAAQVNGGVSFKDVDTLTLGEVTSTVGSTTKTTSGLTTNNNDAIIETSGLLTLDKATNLGTGNLTLVSNGGVTQNAGGDIQAKGLGLQGAGTFSLENANNDVDTFAAQVNGGVSFKDVDTLTLGEVTSTVGSTTKTTSGLTTNNNDAIIETSGLLTLDKATNLGTGNLTLVSNGGVTQNAGGDIQAKGLGLQGAGTFSLENANNDVDTFAAQVNGGVSFKDVDTLTLGEVTSTVGSTTKTTSGLTTNNNDAIIETSGLLTLDKATNLGTGNLTLVSNGGVTQNAGGDIQAKGLGLQGAGTFSLENANNDVDTLAAQVTGSVSLVNSDTVTVDTVTSTVGSTTKTTSAVNVTGDVLIQTKTGDIVLNKGVSSTAGNITLVAEDNFINNVGAGALSAPNGKWLVYATSPSGNVNGWPVLGGSQQFSTTFPTSALFSGNGFLYKVGAPLLPPTPNLLTTEPITFTFAFGFNEREWQYLSDFDAREMIFSSETLLCTTVPVNQEEDEGQKDFILFKPAGEAPSQARIETYWQPGKFPECKGQIGRQALENR